MGEGGGAVGTVWRSLNARLAGYERAMAEPAARWWTRFGPVLVCVLIGSLACFGIDLFTPSLSIDEEVYTVRTGPVAQWIEQDRWGMYLFSRALPQPVLPFISLLIGLAANAVASVLAVSLMGVSGRLRAIGAGLLAACTPVLGFVMHFDTSQSGFFAGLLMAVCSVALLVRGGWRSALAGWLMLVFAVSVYQSVAMVALVVYLGWVLNRRILVDEIRAGGDRVVSGGAGLGGAGLGGLIRDLLIFGVWFATALIGHKGSALAARALFAPDGGYVLVDSVYDGSFFERYDPGPALTQMGQVLLGGAWYMGWQTPVLIGACVVVIVARLVGLRRPVGVRVVGVGVVAALLVAPFLLPLATGDRWPTRTLLAVPVMLAVLLFTATGVRARAHAWVLAAAATVCLFHFAVSNNRLMYADHLSWRADRDLGVRVLDRLDAARPVPAGRVRLALIGQPRWTSSPVRFREETLGGSIFEWDGGNPHRVVFLLRYLGAEGVSATTDGADYRRAIETAAGMPVWPAPGSLVVLEDGLAVVRFGDPSAMHLRFGDQAR